MRQTFFGNQQCMVCRGHCEYGQYTERRYRVRKKETQEKNLGNTIIMTQWRKRSKCGILGRNSQKNIVSQWSREQTVRKEGWLNWVHQNLSEGNVSQILTITHLEGGEVIGNKFPPRSPKPLDFSLCIIQRSFSNLISFKQASVESIFQ